MMTSLVLTCLGSRSIVVRFCEGAVQGRPEVVNRARAGDHLQDADAPIHVTNAYEKGGCSTKPEPRGFLGLRRNAPGR
jgi:hypothetical protein